MEELNVKQFLQDYNYQQLISKVQNDDVSLKSFISVAQFFGFDVYEEYMAADYDAILCVSEDKKIEDSEYNRIINIDISLDDTTKKSYIANLMIYYYAYKHQKKLWYYCVEKQLVKKNKKYGVVKQAKNN